jgi:hypothetical protein
MIRSLKILAGCLAVVLMGAGCAYQLGPTNGAAARGRSLQVKLFKNQTIEPRLSEPVAQALRRQVAQDGTFQLASRDGADVLVTGELVKYERRPVSFQPNDIVQVRDYEIRLTAQVKAIQVGSGEVLLDRRVFGRTLIQSSANQGSAERQGVALVADDLARNITSLLVDGKW